MGCLYFIMPMKHVILFLVFSTGLSVAHGAGYTTTHGVNISGENVSVYLGHYDDTGENELRQILENHPGYDLVTIVVEVNGAVIERFEKQICGFSTSYFSCLPGGDHPLSGAKFTFKKVLTNNRGTLHVCEENCGPRTPPTMVNDPWEGDPEQVYFDVCGHSETIGAITRAIVAVKTQPDSASRTVAELHGIGRLLRIKIVNRKHDCVTVDYETGQWVEIEAHFDELDSPITGWVFDANIEYGFPEYYYN